MATGGYMLVVVVLVLITLGATGVEGQWCVAKIGIPDSQMQAALDFACGHGGTDCGPIQSGGLCFIPDTLPAHASYAFNSYYQKQSRAVGSCDFQGAATVTNNNPSYGACVYPSSPSTVETISLTGVTTPPNSENSNPSTTHGVSSGGPDESGSLSSSTNLS